MVPVKICGIRRYEDVAIIQALKPAYAGFVFAPSKRRISSAMARQLRKTITESRCVGVFVNEPIEQVLAISQSCKLDVIQLHGDEDQSYIQYLKEHASCEIWKAIRIHEASDLNALHNLTPDHFLLDAYHPQMIGGSGKQIDLSLLEGIDLHNIILAGGIQIGNVHAFTKLNPYAIDVSSGVETNGYKNYDKIKNLLEEVEKI